MTELTVKVISTVDEFLSIKAPWDALTGSLETAKVFLTHDWLRIWIESFAADKPLYIVLVHDADRLVGILPLHQEIFFTFRIIRQTCLHSMTNSASVGSGIIARPEDMPRVLEAVLAHLEGDQRRFSRVILEFVPSDLGLVQLLEQRPDRGWAKALITPWEGSYYLNIEGDYDSYKQSLGKSFRKNMRQKENWMKALGGGRFERAFVYDPEMFAHFLDLENTGWKKERGRPIKSCPQSTNFYRSLAETFGAAGCFFMLSLYIDNKLAAMELSVAFNGVCYALKNAVNYDEPSYMRLSLGHMTQQESIRSCFEQKMKTLDFYGYCYPYESHWTKSINRKYEIMLIKRNDWLTRASVVVKAYLQRRRGSGHSGNSAEVSNKI